MRQSSIGALQQLPQRKKIKEESVEEKSLYIVHFAWNPIFPLFLSLFYLFFLVVSFPPFLD